MKQNVIKQYIRNSQTNQPRGVAVAIRKDDEVLYGFSLLNVKMDRFEKKLGIDIATKRALALSYQLPKVVEREVMVLEAFESLEARALKYFKDLDPDKVKLCPSNIESPYIVTE